MTNPVDFDNFTEDYNALLHESTKFFSSNEEYFAKYKVDIACNNITWPVHRVLEYGCGIGRNIPFLQDSFPKALIVGSDISRVSLDMAKNLNSGVEFFHESEVVSFTEPFDLIFVAGVFHHIPPSQRSAAAATIFERLSLGGEVFIFEHNPFNPITRKIVSSCPYDEDAVLLAPSEMKAHLKQAGLFIKRQSFCLFFPPRFSKISFIERHLGWLPFGGQYWVQAKRIK